ncbi:MAG: hypothetical protein JSR73_18090 [Proteobacteria bacterium]|nr:hypothetical protein [Pseudomonadota bacterium]
MGFADIARLWRLAALVLGGLAALPAAAQEYWQVREGHVTVVAAGSPALAITTARRVLQLEATARWLQEWPQDFQPPAVLVFALTPELMLSTFRRTDPAADSAAGSDELPTSLLVTPTLTLVAVAYRAEHRHELAGLQELYLGALFESAPPPHWPPCAETGFKMVIGGAEYDDALRVQIPATRAGEFEKLPPSKFLLEAPTAASEQLIGPRAFSCYLLAQMLPNAAPALRKDWRQLYARLGGGTALAEAIGAGLGGSVEAFDRRFLDFASWYNHRQKDIAVTVELPGTLPAPGVPERLPPERMQALLAQLCAKLGNCR